MPITESSPNPKELSDCTAEAMAELSRFIGLLHKYFAQQFPYDVHTNLPSGLVQRKDLAQHSVESAIVSVISEMYRWDTDAATQFAGRILEDSNVHDLAAVVFSFARPQ
jgi:hypothetical protein